MNHQGPRFQLKILFTVLQNKERKKKPALDGLRVSILTKYFLGGGLNITLSDSADLVDLSPSDHSHCTVWGQEP